VWVVKAAPNLTLYLHKVSLIYLKYVKVSTKFKNSSNTESYNYEISSPYEV
jgi:hypothetical protein